MLRPFRLGLGRVVGGGARARAAAGGGSAPAVFETGHYFPFFIGDFAQPSIDFPPTRVTLPSGLISSEVLKSEVVVPLLIVLSVFVMISPSFQKIS